LGDALQDWKPAEAVGFYRAALVTRPTVETVCTAVGLALYGQGQLDEAIRAFRKAIELDPKGSSPHHDLGLCFQARGQLDEAMAEYRRAIQLDPKGDAAPHQLGVCLQARGQLDEAMAEYRLSIALNPKAGAPSHHQLATCWQARGQLDEAVAEYRRAIELDPKNVPAHCGLGTCWQDRGELDKAMAEYRRVIELDPKEAPAHQRLGLCFQARGQLDEAMAEYRRAIDVNPKEASAHYMLGTCWQARGQLDEAMAEYRRAIDVDPGGGLAHESLAVALLWSGRFTEVRTAVGRAFDLLSAKDSHRPALQETLRVCDRMLALEGRLPALLRGKERPAVEELLELARLCRDYGRPHAAAGLYAAAFVAQPALADDLGSSNRYNAACAAARAGAGQGSAQRPLGEAQRADERQRALAWLRADLTLRTRLLSDGKGTVGSLAAWQTDRDLASVRDPVALAKLPDSERDQWQRLWTDVAALLAADPLEQGKTHAARRDWAKSAASYARVIKGGPTDDGHFWFEYAALLLLSGDRPGYVRACAHMIERCGKDGGPRAYHVARACTLAPDAVTDAPLPGRLAEKELQDSAQAFWSLTEQGALAYRAGRFQQAVPLFEQSLRADRMVGRAVLNWLWLALANERLGKAEEARRWLDKARAWLDQYAEGMPARADEELGLHLHNWLEAHVLCREAEALIEPESPRNRTENPERGTPRK
jgi:tetratricopeptide (TPR) repeat protein